MSEQIGIPKKLAWSKNPKALKDTHMWSNFEALVNEESVAIAKQVLASISKRETSRALTLANWTSVHKQASDNPIFNNGYLLSDDEGRVDGQSILTIVRNLAPLPHRDEKNRIDKGDTEPEKILKRALADGERDQFVRLLSAALMSEKISNFDEKHIGAISKESAVYWADSLKFLTIAASKSIRFVIDLCGSLWTEKLEEGGGYDKWGIKPEDAVELIVLKKAWAANLSVQQNEERNLKNNSASSEEKLEFRLKMEKERKEMLAKLKPGIATLWQITNMSDYDYSEYETRFNNESLTVLLTKKAQMSPKEFKKECAEVLRTANRAFLDWAKSFRVAEFYKTRKKFHELGPKPSPKL